MADKEKSPGLLTGGQVTRREVLKKGLVGAAGLDRSAGGRSPPAAAPPPRHRAHQGPGRPVGHPGSASPAGLSGNVSLGSNLSDAVPKKALQDAIDLFTKANSGVTVKINIVDHSHVPGHHFATTCRARRTTPSPGSPASACGPSSPRASSRRWTTSGPRSAPTTPPASRPRARATTGRCTASRGRPTRGRVYYRKDVWADKGYTIPTTLDEMKTLAAKMKADGLVPIGLGDKDGWPAMGHFDIIDLRENGYQFHVDLMAGKKKWTDPEGEEGLHRLEGPPAVLPEPTPPAAIWQDAAAGLVQKTTGMMLQPQVAETFTAAGAADYAQLAMFPWPHHGTQWDAEEALDAPIDGFMISAKSPTLAADLAIAKALMQHLSTGAAQGIAAKANPANIACASDTDTSGYTDLQKAQVAVLAKAQKLTQFLDRDTKPEFAGVQGMQGFLIDFLQKPDQDLDQLLGKIQTYWDSLA